MLHTKAVPYRLEHTDRLQQQLDQHPPGQAPVALLLTDDAFQRSQAWER